MDAPSVPNLTAPRPTPAGRRDLVTLPKAHLHLHFTGAMRPTTMVDMARSQGVRLPPNLLHIDAASMPADERVGSTASFAPAFRIARRAGLVGVPHGGELLGPASVREVVSALAPARLGHGVRTSEDPALLRAVVDEGIALEVCPTSNVHLGVYTDFSQVPLPTLMSAGATVALAADDPLLFRSRLVAQYEVARDVFGLSDQALASLARSSIDASLASPSRKAAWKADIDAWLAAPVA